MLKKRTIFFLLIIIVVFAFFIRVYSPYKTIFSDGIVRYGDDAIYHMRFLENMLLGGHFPSFFYFDPFVNFPHGAYASLAPLYDFLLALIIWIVSFGRPTVEIIHKIAPFYPAVLGSLIPIVVYFISKAIWGNKIISLLSAFFVAISPPILFKSLLAMNDHHVAEVLFSSLAIMFLFFVIRSAEKGTSIKNKKLWLFVFLCGFSFGLYLLNWTGGILFLCIAFIFLAVFYLKEFISKRPCNWILSAGVIIFLVSFLMILPFLGHPNLSLGMYNINHILTFSGALMGFLALWIFGNIVKNKSFNRLHIFTLLVIFSLLFLLVLKIFFPYLLERIIILANGINANGAASVNFKNSVGEMHPLTFQQAIDGYYSLFFFYLAGFFIVIYNFCKERKNEQLLLIIWSIATFFITGIFPFFGQQRYNIYLAVNVAILAAFVVAKTFEIGIKALHISSHMDKNDFLKSYLFVGSLAILLGLIFFIFYPFPFNVGLDWPTSLPFAFLSVGKVVENPVVLSADWYPLLQWLKEKTPDVGVDIYGLYEGPKIDKNTGKAIDYLYPDQAYGILANWDYGHAIEYYSHRPVVANNFQMGIGKKENGKVTELGASVFFFETNEGLATYYLDKLKVKYVITDEKFSSLKYFSLMVNWIQGNTNGYSEDTVNSLTKADDSMLVKLHFLNGSETKIKNNNYNNINLIIPALNHFRLLYESNTTVRVFPSENSLNELKTAKVFEYVKGARIKGYTIPGVQVEISTNVRTNQNRGFKYKQTIESKDGTFEFTVPYSTGKQEQSETFATEYTIKIGNYSKKIKVSEEDILQGKTIFVN